MGAMTGELEQENGMTATHAKEKKEKEERQYQTVKYSTHVLYSGWARLQQLTRNPNKVDVLARRQRGQKEVGDIFYILSNIYSLVYRCNSGIFSLLYNHLSFVELFQRLNGCDLSVSSNAQQ